MDYGRIKQLAKDSGCSITDLIALAPQNDPFYVGTNGDMEKAEWFAEMWQRFGYGQGVHLRRVHYQLVSQNPPVLKPNGKPYENTENDWGWLDLASKCARYLGLVDPGAFEDRRNPDPALFAEYGDESGLDYGISEPYVDLIPTLEAVKGYTDSDLQPYHLEVWVEKTTMNDVLLPLCQRYGANLVTGAGELSITAALEAVHRVQQARRPCRIFYISDFDPAGYGMPISVARKIEFFLSDLGASLDIRLDPIALTRDQVTAYRLPRTPIKQSERRKVAFEDIHGAGAVELDALEALYPGKLAQVVTGAVAQYYDQDAQNYANIAYGRLQRDLKKAQAAILGEFQKEIDSLSAVVSDLQARIQAKMESVRIPTGCYQVGRGELRPESNGILYDSRRAYLEQLAAYKAQRAGENIECDDAV